jgi:hypothetical protein
MEPTFLESLRKHRADAAARRNRLDERIRALDVLIAQESQSPAADDVVLPGIVSGGFGSGGSVTVVPPLPAAVTEALTRHGGALGFPDLLAAVSRVQGQNVNEKSLRGTLPRMEREGKIVKPQRGLYALPTYVEGSTVAAVEPSIPTPSTQEEGGANGTDAPRVRDADSSGQAIHLDHGFGAPV